MELLLLAEVMDKVEEAFGPGLVVALVLAAGVLPLAGAVGRHAPAGFVLLALLVSLALGGGCAASALADDVARYAEMEAGRRGLLMATGPELVCAGTPLAGLLAGFALRCLVRRFPCNASVGGAIACARDGDALQNRAKL